MECDYPNRLHGCTIWRFMLGSCWHLLHLMVSVVHIWTYVIRVLHCYLISSGLLKKYRSLQLHKLRHLAIVVDSEEAKCALNIKRLLHWLSDIGVKHVIVYDKEGVMKKSDMYSLKEATSSSLMSFCDGVTKTLNHLDDREVMSVELLSFSDGKEGAAQAASFLCSKYLNDDNISGIHTKPVFTESDMASALKAVGCGGPDPDLLLVFSPARSHLGFPAWRMRYTEIMHLGPLKSVKHGAIIKAIYDFTTKRQNYGR